MTTQKSTNDKSLKLTCIKILIIEDNPICASTLKSLLQSLGPFDITIASTGTEALKLFSENFYLIITDFNLPDMNGIEITKYYRTIFPKKDTPIICCSTDIEKIRRECIEAGMDDFLSKPVTAEDVEEMLACWIPRFIRKS